MRKSIPIIVVFSMFGMSVALAQNTAPGMTTGAGGSANSSSSSSSSGKGIPQAPVGHRQPKASDVPAGTESGYTESAQDKELDRKIKSICRGC